MNVVVVVTRRCVSDLMHQKVTLKVRRDSFREETKL